MLSQEIKEKVSRMSALVSEMQTYWMYKEKLERIPLKGKKEDELIRKYQDYIDSLIEQFDVLNSSIIQGIGGAAPLEVPSPVKESSENFKKVKAKFQKEEKKKKLFQGNYIRISRREKKQILSEINITKKQLKEFSNSKTKKREIYNIQDKSFWKICEFLL